jgi:uncharacterized damage-inducible protein DinB
VTLHDVRTLLDYDRWATGLQLDAVAGLSEAEYHKDLGSSYGGVHGTLVHIYGAQRLWLDRWRGTAPGRLASEGEVAGLAELRDLWTALRAELDRFVASLSEERLHAPFAYTDLQGNAQAEPLVQQVHQVMNHSTYHRGQITTFLRQLRPAAAPPSTDLIRFYRLQRA